ncbi:hypothetical protein [Alkaliphilus peptidifermentans]|uniref:DUF4829 domain-containing protein n=1 Tax=Alkaliphilus peptidifermentans DSM 18978 TaxID=1120976 RepID=A0A1G5KQG9_9FIRM|nr:hypothetical protein [Alkaliphilus peptidifermentans]SCZ02360.1 hypothetical protein SAMN03080606_03653 [Alkaliphilus peptidifermentans DSM 18978]
MYKNKIFVLVILILFVGCFYFISSIKTAQYEHSIEILENQIEELEEESRAIKEHYKTEYELRNLLDIKSRKIYKAIEKKDLITLEAEISEKTQIFSDKVIFREDNKDIIYDFQNSELSSALRQRYYELSADKSTFITGYEMLFPNAESIPVIIMTYIYENGDWKLSSIVFE